MRRADSLPADDVGALVVMRMGAANAGHHLRPICAAVAPQTVVIVRPSSEPASLFGPNAATVDTSSRWRVLEVLRTAIIALWVAITTRPAHVFSFNAVPYGIMAAGIGRLTTTPVHVGFVGTDAQRVDRHPWLLKLLGHPDIVTTTGSAMTDILTRHDIGARIEVLAHGVDAARFNDGGSADRDIDLVFVGGLLPHKRVDLILRAVARVRVARPEVRAVIVGAGPDEARLRSLQQELDIFDCTELVGHDPQPERWFARAKLLVLASAWEGLPFVVVEAMRCGVVPVATDVGSIADLVTHGESGLLVSPDPSVDELVGALLDLLADDERREAMRQAALHEVAGMTYESLATWWSDVLAGSQ